MNNMKYYNDSLAYDFEMFMPKTSEKEKKRDNIVVLPDTNAANRKRAAAKSLAYPMYVIMAVVFILAAVCGNIVLRLEINEINNQISEAQTSISNLDSKKTSLEMEMQKRISYANLELEATQLGMKKLEKKNVKYIRVNDKDTAVKSDGSIIKNEE